MRRIWWVLLTALLLTAVCLYQTVHLILQQNAEPASLAAYPDHEEIEQTLRSRRRGSQLLDHPPLRARGRYIVDETDTRFKLVTVNWYGASDVFQIPGGLDVQHRDDICRTIRRLGFNSVRLPYADQMVRENPLVSPALLAANADLVGLRALDVYHAVVQSLTDAGIAVIVNNHITQARWCCDLNPCDCQWKNTYLSFLCTVRQSEAQWIANWETVMRPHIHNPLVIGADLRNEVRGLIGRQLWYDWARAAERVAEHLHRLQPNWLMFVEGVNSANDLSLARRRPVTLSIPDRLVYSVHIYGWSGWGSLRPYWRRSPASFRADMHHNWAYLLDHHVAPVWIGEFGAPDHPNRGDLHYWTMLIDYLHDTDADWAYWALNPRKPVADGSNGGGGEVESYTLLEDDWCTPKFDYRLFDLVPLMTSLNRTEKLVGQG